jgi:hypothetical protein
MRPVRLIAAGSIGLAALLSVAAPAVANAAIQQVQSARTQGSRVLDDEEDRSHPCDAAAFDATQVDVRDPVDRQPSPPAARQPSAPRAGPRDRPFVAVLMAVPLVTYAGAAGSRGSEILTPADRFATSQLIGAGYVVNPKFRFGVMGIFNEVLTGQPPAVDAWQFGGIAPIAIGTFEHVYYRRRSDHWISLGRQTSIRRRCGRTVRRINPSQKRPRIEHRCADHCAVRASGHSIRRRRSRRGEGVLRRACATVREWKETRLMVPVEAHLVLNHVPLVGLMFG